MQNNSFRKIVLSTSATVLLAGCQLLGTSALAGNKTEFTLVGGALIELVYINTADNNSSGSELISSFEQSVEKAGGDFLVGFDIEKNLAKDNPATHVAMLQWSSPDARKNAIQSYDELGGALGNVAFFAVQKDTPVSLDHSKTYDFTSAWTIGKTPEEMGIVMRVLGTYFQKIGPVIKDYGISTRAFMMGHPGAPAVDNAYTPQITGLFEWQKMEDHSKFQSDDRWLEHVDIRNAVLARKEDILLGTVID